MFFKEYPHLQNDFLELSEDEQRSSIEAVNRFLKASLRKMIQWLPLKNKILFESENISLKRFDPEGWDRIRLMFTNIVGFKISRRINLV